MKYRKKIPWYLIIQVPLVTLETLDTLPWVLFSVQQTKKYVNAASL